MWKRLSSKVLLEHRYLLVEEDEVQMTNGRRTHWLRYGSPFHGVVILALNDSQDVLFIREYSYVQQKFMLQLPMGAIDSQQSPEQCAYRELQEEGGYAARKLELMGSFAPNHRRSLHTAHVFQATDLFESSLPQDEEEIIKPEWIARDQISELIKQGEIVDAITLSSLRICGL